ncbi:MAG TPA: hypothetical protein VF523_06965 [Burkholderiales bacterium]
MRALFKRSRRSRIRLAATSLLLGLALLADTAPLAAAYRYLPAEVRPIWMKLDVNADGKISRDELREEDPRLLAGFDRADLDHDGTLSLRELELLLLSA